MGTVVPCGKPVKYSHNPMCITSNFIESLQMGIQLACLSLNLYDSVKNKAKKNNTRTASLFNRFCNQSQTEIIHKSSIYSIIHSVNFKLENFLHNIQQNSWNAASMLIRIGKLWLSVSICWRNRATAKRCSNLFQCFKQIVQQTMYM